MIRCLVHNQSIKPAQLASCEVERDTERERNWDILIWLYEMLQLHIKSGYSSYLGLLLTVTPLDMEIQSSSVRPDVQPLATNLAKALKYWIVESERYVRYEVNCFALIWQFTFDRAPHLLLTTPIITETSTWTLVCCQERKIPTDTNFHQELILTFPIFRAALFVLGRTWLCWVEYIFIIFNKTDRAGG